MVRKAKEPESEHPVIRGAGHFCILPTPKNHPNLSQCCRSRTLVKLLSTAKAYELAGCERTQLGSRHSPLQIREVFRSSNC